MERLDRDRIIKMAIVNPELRRLYQKHEQFETLLSKYSGRAFLTAIEEQEEKRLKKEKLAGVDRMLQIVGREYSKAA